MGTFSKSLFANVFNVTISTLTGLLIPKLMGATQYGYWQLYVLYVTYVPYFHFGWVDGIYLREGGIDYNDLDKPKLHTQFWMYCIFDLAVSLGILSLGFAFVGGERHIMMLAALDGIILLPRLFFQYLLQATGRVEVYAHNLVLERILCAITQILFLVLGFRSYGAMILSDLFAKVVTLVCILVNCKDIIHVQGCRMHDALRETREDFRVGIKLTFATVSGMLLIGIIQFMIERQWSIEIFGMVSFALVCFQGILSFINQVSVVLFPLLKTSEPGHYPLVFRQTGCYITSLCTFALMAFFPISLLLGSLVPEYSMGIMFLGMLMPMILFEGRNTLLLNTFLKTLRKEKVLLVVNIIMLCLTVMVSYLFVFLLKDLKLVMLGILFLLALRCLLADIMVHTYLGLKDYREFGLSLVTTMVFLCSCCVLTDGKGIVLYACYFLAYYAIRRKDYREAYAFLHGNGKEKPPQD